MRKVIILVLIALLISRILNCVSSCEPKNDLAGIEFETAMKYTEINN